MSGSNELPANLPEFSGKVVNLNLIDDEADRDLLSPEFVMQADRLFLVGVVPASATSSGWSDGAVGSVAWDRVSSYLTFESLEAYDAAVKRSRESD